VSHKIESTKNRFLCHAYTHALHDCRLILNFQANINHSALSGRLMICMYSASSIYKNCPLHECPTLDNPVARVSFKDTAYCSFSENDRFGTPSLPSLV
jgi:hypothetical protein